MEDAARESHRDAIDKALDSLTEQASAIGDRSYRIATEMLGPEQPPEVAATGTAQPNAWLVEVHGRIRNARRILEDVNANLVRIEADVVTQQPVTTTGVVRGQ